jgi:flagellar hook-length control protein FliK
MPRTATAVVPLILLAACSAAPAAPTAGSVTAALPATAAGAPAAATGAFCAAAGEWLASPAMTKALLAARAGKPRLARKYALSAAEYVQAMTDALPATAPDSVRKAFTLYATATRGQRSPATGDRARSEVRVMSLRVLNYTTRVCLGR